MGHHSPPNHHTQPSISSANLNICCSPLKPLSSSTLSSSVSTSKYKGVITEPLGRARPTSRPTLGAKFDPSEDRVSCNVVGGEKRTRFDGAFFTGGNGEKDSQHLQRLEDGGLGGAGLKSRTEGCGERQRVGISLWFIPVYALRCAGRIQSRPWDSYLGRARNTYNLHEVGSGLLSHRSLLFCSMFFDMPPVIASTSCGPLDRFSLLGNAAVVKTD